MSDTKRTKKLAHLFEYLGKYWTDFRNLFTVCADDGSVPHFPIFQGTLPWQPNNVVKML